MFVSARTHKLRWKVHFWAKSFSIWRSFTLNYIVSLSDIPKTFFYALRLEKNFKNISWCQQIKTWSKNIHYFCIRIKIQFNGDNEGHKQNLIKLKPKNTSWAPVSKTSIYNSHLYWRANFNLKKSENLFFFSMSSIDRLVF